LNIKSTTTFSRQCVRHHITCILPFYYQSTYKSYLGSPIGICLVEYHMHHQMLIIFMEFYIILLSLIVNFPIACVKLSSTKQVISWCKYHYS